MQRDSTSMLASSRSWGFIGILVDRCIQKGPYLLMGILRLLSRHITNLKFKGPQYVHLSGTLQTYSKVNMSLILHITCSVHTYIYTLNRDQIFQITKQIVHDSLTHYPKCPFTCQQLVWAHVNLAVTHAHMNQCVGLSTHTYEINVSNHFCLLASMTSCLK